MLDNLFKNIGKKIKFLTEIVFTLLVLVCVFVTIYCIIEIPDAWWLFLLAFILEVVFAWIGMFFMYGFGELIDKVMDIDKRLSGEMVNPTVMGSPNYPPMMMQGRTPAQPLVAACELCRDQVALTQLMIVKDEQGNDHYVCKNCLNTRM